MEDLPYCDLEQHLIITNCELTGLLRNQQKTRKLNKNPTPSKIVSDPGTGSLTVFSIHGDYLAVTFHRARTCHYIIMTLCHYDSVFMIMTSYNYALMVVSESV